MPVAAIIIPAHNEEAMIAKCLSTMLRGALRGEFDIIVATNGCTDRTPEIAKTFDGVRVVDTPIASKVTALNIADLATDVWPRIYVDADVQVTARALRETADVITSGKALAAAPRFDVDLNGRPWTVRAFYQIYLQMPWTQSGMIGSGLFGLSKKGHDRLGSFPDVMNEDLVVSRLFTTQERVSIESVTFTIAAPHNLRTLLAIKTRVATGNLAYKRNPPVAIEQHRPKRSQARYWHIIKQPMQWPALAVYSFVYGVTRIGARFRIRSKKARTWTRDQTIRTVPQA